MKLWISARNLCLVDAINEKCGTNTSRFYNNLHQTVFQEKFPLACDFSTKKQRRTNNYQFSASQPNQSIIADLTNFDWQILQDVFHSVKPEDIIDPLFRIGGRLAQSDLIDRRTLLSLLPLIMGSGQNNVHLSLYIIFFCFTFSILCIFYFE